MKLILVGVILYLSSILYTEAYNTQYMLDSSTSSGLPPYIILLDHERQKRDTSPPAQEATTAHASNSVAPAPAPPTIAVAAQNTPPAAPSTTTSANDSNKSLKETKTASVQAASVTQVPILGANGTGQRWANATGTSTKVSDPITPVDRLVMETPVRVEAGNDINNGTDGHHLFYNSTFVGNEKYFNEYWQNLSRTSYLHDMLSNSHRRATTVKLSFPFPFYGNWIRNITVATGGFIYTGEHTHAWLAATQYIAPLMANFDTSLSNDSVVKLSDDGEKFSAFWENVTLRESPGKKFTFAVTLHKNGDIVFAYKTIPISINDIDDSEHPVKIGISDAYLTDKIIFYLRRKTIHEYHRVSFTNYEVTNHTILKMFALPTCLQYSTCNSCVNHNTSFNCSWCEAIGKCSSGTDRNKQDWKLRNCNKLSTNTTAGCPSNATLGDPNGPAEEQFVYGTEVDNDEMHDAVVKSLHEKAKLARELAEKKLAEKRLAEKRLSEKAAETHSGMGGVVAAFMIIGLICSFGAWVVYAFKNPHTRSGQLLIKYRPSQWNWRRGEARYTAATIHM